MSSKMDCTVKFVITCIVVATLSSVSSAVQSGLNPSILTQSKNLGDCQACKLFVESFKKGLERTARGKFEGGDTAWEEEKLKKSYKRSEVRLVDIQEGLCRESKHSVQCHHIAEKSEDFIEEWWAQDPDESDDLFTYICIDKMEMCCPKLHYGKDCTPCPGDHSIICSGNGKCRGDGTRKGNGTCLCDKGYIGDNCDDCALDYYLKESSLGVKIVCLPCHPSCLGGCRQGSQKDCVACKPGFTFDSEEGCLDINECNDENKCSSNEFCMNSLGSYTCMKCDKACDGCYSDGPDTCRKCAPGYSKSGELCISTREEDDQSDQLTTTRNEEL